jgi:nucleotide-binding universal stress UspA family protein
MSEENVEGEWPSDGYCARMISTVAVGTDGSETAEEAVRQAAELARRYRAKLVLLSASLDSRGLVSPGSPAAIAGIELQWASSSQAEVRTFLERSETALREEGIECETRSAEGDPADVLVRLAAECGADLLVIGNKGMKRRVLGSVPNKVTHKADCTVMVVKTT